MKLHKIFLFAVVLLAGSSLSVIMYNAYQLHVNDLNRLNEIQSQFLNDTFSFNRSKLIGNIIINDSEITLDYLKDIHDSRNVNIELVTSRSETFSVGESQNSDIVKKYVLENNGMYYGTITFSSVNGLFKNQDTKRIFFTIVLEIIFILTVLLILAKYFKVYVLNPLHLLILSIRSNKECLILEKDSIDEIVQLSRNYSKMRNEIKKNANDQALNEIASQVAHDIRSPLAALDVATEYLDQLPEEVRVMIRTGVSRIKDIANNLLVSRRAISEVNCIKSKPEVTLLSALIESIVSEKRIQNMNNPDIEIIFEINSFGYGCFSEIDQIEFKRMMSNLINNSIEAFSNDQGKIIVELKGNKDNIELLVKDNGIGIEDDILKELGQLGKSFGKEDGNGLGVYHAKKIVQSWGGKFEIISKKGLGTEIKITLLKSSAPFWFVDKIIIRSDIVILDDDKSIHQVWDSKFCSANLKNYNLYHFSSISDIEAWLLSNGNRELLLLCDYELIGENLNGLEFIEKNDISKQSILVTSRYSEKHVKSKCQELGIKLIPKPLVSFVPIN